MDLEKKSIERIKLASEMSRQYYQKPLACTYSGGKDSDVMLELFKRSEVPFEVYHSFTTADAPETVYHVWDVFRKLEMQAIPDQQFFFQMGGNWPRLKLKPWNWYSVRQKRDR